MQILACVLRDDAVQHGVELLSKQFHLIIICALQLQRSVCLRQQEMTRGVEVHSVGVSGETSL